MHEVVILRERTSWFWPCLIVILALMYWKWVLFVVGLLSALFLLGWAIRVLHQDARDQRALVAAQQANEQRRKQELARRAVVEDTLFHAGDPRGIYGLDYSDGQEPWG
jgi:hypothetical protein